MIAQWLFDHHKKTGKWANGRTPGGPVPRETWKNLDQALRNGHRGLPDKSSLTILKEQRDFGVRLLNEDMIAQWLLDHHKKTGKWANQLTPGGPIPGETWKNLDPVLRNGHRGLPGKSSLTILKEQRGFGALNEDMIAQWLLDHHKKMGGWVNSNTPGGPIPGETWKSLDNVLRKGLRGLPSGSSLAKLKKQRGLGKRLLNEDMIAQWLLDHYKKTGKWANQLTPGGPVPRETWKNLDQALRKGLRGLPSGSSLAILKEQGGFGGRPLLNEDMIAQWLLDHHKKTGKWANQHTPGSPVPGETWRGLDQALRRGHRGLPLSGSSLAKLKKERGFR